MIPKIIHLCWISGDPYPPKIKKCIDSWNDGNGGGYLTDYQIIVWDYKKVMSLGYKWIRQAVEEKKYAFAADCVRLYALYHYGGIYLDSDVEVLKPFDDLLGLPYFMGAQDNSAFEVAVVGAEPKLEWIKECLDYYKHRSFINVFGEYHQPVLPQVVEWRIERKFKLKTVSSLNEFDYSPDVVCCMPLNWFCPMHWHTREISITPQTYCIHHMEGEWLKTKWYKENVGLVVKLLRWVKKVASYTKHKLLHID